MEHTPRFIKSALLAKDYPLHGAAEFAFVGASNSGKSSLINSLLGKNLCKTSSKPGHTSLVNFFMAKKGICFVDLPGYGYAKKSFKEQQKWREAIESYLSKRNNLALCFVLFDLKRGLMQNDLNLIEWFQHEGMPFTLVATKVDKLNQKERSKQVKLIKPITDEVGLMQSSSVKGLGLKEIWSQVEALVEIQEKA